MKNLPKIAGIFAALAFTLVIVLIVTAFLLQDKVSGIILSNLNRNIATRIDVGSMKLSFLRSFPRASVELRNVVVHSSPGFSKADFPGQNTDTLLTAHSVFVILRPIDIFRGNYNIETINAKSGNVNLLSDMAGRVNYNISTGNKSDTSSVAINLDKITLSEMKAHYLNLATGFSIDGRVKEGSLKSRIRGSTIDFTALSDISVDSLRIKDAAIRHPFEAAVDLSLHSSSEGITFGKSTLTVDDYDFSIEGSISARNVYDLLIKGRNVDISGFTRYLPAKMQQKASEYNPSGKLEVSCVIKGPVSKTMNPHIEINCGLQNGRISYSGSKSAVENISFDGRYSNGSANNAQTSSVTLNNLKVRLGSSGYTGSLSTRNFDNPVTEIILKGEIRPSEVISFFAIDGISAAQGSVDADLKIITQHRLRDSITMDAFIDLETDGTLYFKAFTLGLKKQDIAFRNVNGILSLSDTYTYTTPGLSFEYSGQKINFKGETRNLPAWLAGRRVTLYVAGDAAFSRFSPDAYLEDDGKSKVNEAVSFPSDMVVDLGFRIDSLQYRTFSAKDVTGSLTYKPRLLTFRSLKLKTLEGAISGNGFIVQNSNKSFVARGDFNLNDIDVNNAFATFNNFGQSFIVKENLSGHLSGSVSVLLPMNSDFKPRQKDLTAEGKYILTDGALINFEPVKKLSSFIELSELENIHFEKLENDFFIRNNAFVIPQMDVKSSAADLAVNGRHSFDNNYEYHVKILLSQILSKKRRASKRTVTEFGAVKDDGLGRTSLLLKVENRGEDVKVSYDLKAVGQQINSNLLKEKQSLKNILDEEYGRADETQKQPVQAAPEKKPGRFSISWEESDSVPPAIKEEEEKGFRNLFRKK